MPNASKGKIVRAGISAKSTHRLGCELTGANYNSLPFGDGGSENVSESYAGWDFEHFGDMDVDSWDSTYHAQFRNYSQLQARWLSPDP